MTTAISEDRLFTVIIRGSLALLLLLTLGGWLLFSRQTGLGAFAGGSIAIVNFFWMRNVLQRILLQLPPKAGTHAVLRYIARLGINAVILYMIIVSGWVSIAGLFAGLSVIVLNIIAISIYNAVNAGG